MKQSYPKRLFAIFCISCSFLLFIACNIASGVRCSKGKSKIKANKFASKKKAKPKRSVSIQAFEAKPFARKMASNSQLKSPQKNKVETTILTQEPIQAAETAISETTEQLVFMGKTYQEDEVISFNANISFIPNHDILINPNKASHKLQELMNLLNNKPNAKVDIIGNVGWGSHVDKDKDYSIVDDENGGTYKLYFGKDSKVYPQKVFTSDAGYRSIIIKHGRTPKDHIHIGKLMESRATAIKDLLVEMGIDANRMTVKKGEFFKTPDRFVSFVIK